jgi:hypothetical protein
LGCIEHVPGVATQAGSWTSPLNMQLPDLHSSMVVQRNLLMTASPLLSRRSAEILGAGRNRSWHGACRSCRPSCQIQAWDTSLVSVHLIARIAALRTHHVELTADVPLSQHRHCMQMEGLEKLAVSEDSLQRSNVGYFKVRTLAVGLGKLTVRVAYRCSQRGT